jgi:hypothetical protein
MSLPSKCTWTVLCSVDLDDRLTLRIGHAEVRRLHVVKRMSAFRAFYNHTTSIVLIYSDGRQIGTPAATTIRVPLLAQVFVLKNGNGL